MSKKWFESIMSIVMVQVTLISTHCPLSGICDKNNTINIDN